MINSRLIKLTALVCVSVLVLGCVQAVSSSVGLAAGVSKTAVKSTASVAGAGVKVATSGNDHHDTHHSDDDPRPFDEKSNATMDVDIALASARISGKRVLLVLGGNWCHDSRGLAGKFQQAELSAVISEYYELVYVDVGHRDRNLHIGERFGVTKIFGTPTVLILSPMGELLNEDSVHDWRTADSKPYDEALAYFQSFSRAGMSTAQ